MRSSHGSVAFRFAAGVLAATAVLSALPAAAADIWRKAPVIAAPAYSWSGIYLGAHAGYGWGRGSAFIQPLLFGVPTTLAATDLEEIPDTYRLRSSGFIGGGQIGVNQQINQIVLGIEADASYSRMRGSATVTGFATSGGPPVTSPFLSTHSQHLNALATLRARAGVLTTEALLLYATGGLAIGWVEESTRLQFFTVGGTTFRGSLDSARAGWTVGGGGEYRLGGNWTGKVEYLYFDLGSRAVGGIDVLFPLQPFQMRARFDMTGHIVRAGINFKLN